VILELTAALVLAVTDPCAPVAPAASPSPAVAAEYRAVAQAEEAAGNPDTAAAAWRLVAANDPGDARAREALAALCREKGSAKAPRAPMEEAIRLLDAGEYRKAAELLRKARMGRPAPEAALIEGICRYELGEDAEATRLLREAEADGELRDGARLYLGLLALRAGAAREAAGLFDSAADSRAFSVLAGDLARAARWDGPWLVSLLAEAGFDSNVRLTDAELETARGRSITSQGDAIWGLSGIGLWRPFGANGLFLRGAGSFQDYSRLDEYDFTSVEAAAGGRWWRGGDGVTAEYAFANRTLGGYQYLMTHRILGSGAIAAGPLSFGASWWGRWEEYDVPYEDFSGFNQRAEGRVSVALGTRARLGFAWVWGRDDAGDPANSWEENGPRADLRLLLGPKQRLSAEVGWVHREHDEPGTYTTDGTTVTTVLLEEDAVDGSAALEWDLGRRTTLRFSLAFRWVDSNYAPFDYTKFVPSAALGLMITP
jgi:hypothetical protein